MPKKQVKNAFYFYMLDVQSEMFRKSGRKIPMKDMPSVAGPRWSAMTEAERAPYSHRAKVEKKTATGVVREGRMDNRGEMLSERRDEMLEMEERRETERIEIKQSIKKGRDAILQDFFFIHFQYLVDMPPDQSDLKYQPVEVSLAKYSIEAGIIETLHRFVHPGPIPLGFRYLCQEHSDKTHKLPIEGFELAEDNYRLLLADIEHFINPDKRQQRPPVFAMRNTVAAMCECCVQWIGEQAGILCDITVCEAEVLFKFLDENIDPSSSMTIYSAEKRLGSDTWDHTPGIRCPQHQRLDTQHCTLATVKRYCYVISEDLCPKYAVSITDNHLPPEEPVVGSIITYGGVSNKPRGVQRPLKVPSASAPPIGRGRASGPAPSLAPVRQAAGRGRGALSFAEVRQPRGGDAMSQYPPPTTTPQTSYQDPRLLPQATPTGGGAWAGQPSTSTHLLGAMQGTSSDVMYHHGNNADRHDTRPTAVYHGNVVDPRTNRSSNHQNNSSHSDKEVAPPQSKRPPPGFTSPVHITQGHPRPPGPAPSPHPPIYGGAQPGVRLPMSYAGALGLQSDRTAPYPPTR